jgi:hypothetical protein
METWHPRSTQSYRNAPPLLMRPTIFFFKKAFRSCRESWHLPFREWPSYWRGKIRSVTNRDERNWFHLRDPEYYVDLVTSATFHAVSRYQPKPYPGPLLNVIASSRPLPSATHDTRLTWSELAVRGGQTVLIPAEDSGRLFTVAHVQELARHLVAYFNHGDRARLGQSNPASSDSDTGPETVKPPDFRRSV